MKYLLVLLVVILALSTVLSAKHDSNRRSRSPPRKSFKPDTRFTQQVELKRNKKPQSPKKQSPPRKSKPEKKDKVFEANFLKMKAATEVVDVQDIEYYINNPEALRQVSDYVFDFFDEDQSGEIDCDEFYVILVYGAGYIHSVPPTRYLAHHWLDLLDIDESSNLCKDEFFAGFQSYAQSAYEYYSGQSSS